MTWDPRRWSIFNRYEVDEPEKVDHATDADFRALFQTDRGARVLAQIMIDGELFLSTQSKHRVDRDMIDGKRELALSIFERAGFVAGDLPVALVTDNLKNARQTAKETDDERNQSRSDPIPGPEFAVPIGDE